MSSDGPTTKTSSTTTPYPQGKQLLDTGLTDALGLYKQKRLNPATGLSSLTQSGMTGELRNAQGSIAPLSQSLQQFRNMAGGSGDISSSGQLDIAGRALGPSMTEQNLSGVAKGDFIGQNDPNYERLRQRAMENASTEAGMAASGLGRSGSDYHQTAVARQVGDTVAGMDMARLKEEQDRQLQANSLIDQLRQSGYGIGLNAQNSASALQGGNQDRRFAANSAIPGAVAATAAPYQTITGLGRAHDVNNAANAGVPGANLSSLLSILGLAAPYGTTQGTTQEPSNQAGQWGGGLLGLGSILSQM